MKICLVSEEFPVETQKGGIATYQYHISKDFILLGHEVHVICKTLESNDREEVFEGVYLHYISGKSEENLDDNILYRKKVTSKMKELEEKIDIFEVADWGAEGFYYLKNRKKPVVIKLHTPLFVWNRYNQVAMTDRMKKVEKEEIESLKLADSIYSCSNSLAKMVKEELPSIGDIEVIYNPMPEIKRHFNRKEQKFILFVGSLEERKGVLNLAYVLNDFLEQNPDFKFVFAGKDTNRNQYNKSTISVILSRVKSEFHSRIIFKGQCSKEMLEQLFLTAYTCIFPSLFENFPYVMLEAISMGCPVIGSINGGMAEIIQDGNSGWLCDPYSQKNLLKTLQNVLNTDENERCSVAKRAKKRVIDLNLGGVAETTVDYYKKVIKKYEVVSNCD